MSILDTLKADLLQARKDRKPVVVTTLSTLVGELQANAKLVDGVKVVTDDAACAVIKKTIKGLDEMIGYNPTETSYVFEKELLEKYLPKMLTYEELLDIFIKMGKPSTKDFMSYLKVAYPNQYDGKVAASIKAIPSF